VPTAHPDPTPAVATVLGLVVDSGPGTVPRLQLHGRTLVAHARDTLMAVPGVDVLVVGGGVPHGLNALAPDEPWRTRVGGTLLVHDPHCPLLPPPAIHECLDRLAATGPASAVIGVRPVTDTIKEVLDGSIASTVDRDSLTALASPVAVGHELLDPLSRALPLAGQLADLPAVVKVLSDVGTVVPVQVPSSARRVSHGSDVELLECLHELRHTLRER
jgi:2-C-methyl-D-erythritol 4-phosphate cytidylyltransferase